MKICFTASMGGHLEEVSQLKQLAENNEAFLITEESDFQNIKVGERTYYVEHINRRESGFLVKFWGLCKDIRIIMKKENPDCVISLGALITVPVCIFAKLKGKKVIYVESFARTKSFSLTGKIMYPIADLFIVQSPILEKRYKKAVYGGSVF